MCIMRKIILFNFALICSCTAQSYLTELCEDFGKKNSLVSEKKTRYEELCRRENIDFELFKRRAKKNNVSLDFNCPKEFDSVYRILVVGNARVSSTSLFIKNNTITLFKEQQSDYSKIISTYIEDKLHLKKLSQIFINPYPIKSKDWSIEGIKNPATLLVERIDNHNKYDWAIRSNQSTDKESYLKVLDIFLAITNLSHSQKAKENKGIKTKRN